MNPYIQYIADREGETPEEILRAIRKALELAWASNDPQHIYAREKLTGSLTVPEPEEFIAAVVREVKNIDTPIFYNLHSSEGENHPKKSKEQPIHPNSPTECPQKKPLFLEE